MLVLSPDPTIGERSLHSQGKGGAGNKANTMHHQTSLQLVPPVTVSEVLVTGIIKFPQKQQRM